MRRSRLQQLDELRSGFRAAVDRHLHPAAADLADFLESGRPATAQEKADAAHFLAQPRQRRQDDLFPEPPACA
jgi:hypothetical protein